MLSEADKKAKKNEYQRKWAANHRDRVNQFVYNWNKKNRRRFIGIVRKSQIKVVDNAKQVLGGKCADKGCNQPLSQLQFHHTAGDGKAHRKELGARDTATLARWVLRTANPEARVELRCSKHHLQADRELTLMSKVDKLLWSSVMELAA